MDDGDALDLCEGEVVRDEREDNEYAREARCGEARTKRKKRLRATKASPTPKQETVYDGDTDSPKMGTHVKKLKKKKKKKVKKRKDKKASLLGIEDEVMQAILAAAEQKQKALNDQRNSIVSGGRRRGSTSKRRNKNSNSNNNNNPNEDESPPKDPLLERQQMQENVERCLRKTEILRGRLESLGLKEQMIQQRIIEEKKRMRNVGGVRATLDQKLKAAKRTKILNTKLERLHLRRNDINVENNALKASINERRKERMAFESIQCKLRADFEQKQKEMANLLRSSNELITNRIRAEKDLKRVEREESIAKEKANSELDRLEGIVRKQEVIQTEMQTASLKRRAHQIREQLGRGRLDPEEEAKLKARLQSLTVKIEKKSHEIDATHQLTLLNYEEAFEKILAEVPARSDKPMTLSEVVENYVDDYDEAFSLLSYIQGIQDENFQLETEIANLRDEMGRLTSQQGKEDQNKERIRRELQRRLETLRQQNLRLNDSIQDRERSRELTFATVERIMTRFNTTLAGHIGLIDGTVCDDHVMHVLGQVELKALQLTQLLQQSIRLGTFRGMPARGQITTPSPALVRQATFRAGKIRIGPTSPHRSTKALIPSVQPLSSVKIQELFTAHIRLLEDPADDEADTLARTETRASGFHEQDFGGPGSPLESRPRLSIQSVDDLRRIIQQNFPLVDTVKPKASTP